MKITTWLKIIVPTVIVCTVGVSTLYLTNCGEEVFKGEYHINQSTDFYNDWQIDPIRVSDDKLDTYDSNGALKLLASQKNYEKRITCAIQRMANAAANKMIEEAYPGVTNFNWNAELTLKYFVVGKKFDVYFSGNGQDVNIGTDKLQFSYQLKNYRIEYAFTNEINNHNNFHLTISKKDKTHFEKYAYNTGAYTQSEVSTRPKDVGAHSLDDIGTII